MRSTEHDDRRSAEHDVRWLTEYDVAAFPNVGSAIHGSAPRFPTGKAAEPFYRSPVVWLAAALFGASLVGCIVTIVLALGQPDGALPDVGERLLSVPTMHAEDGR